jgi:hypothetical protein
MLKQTIQIMFLAMYAVACGTVSVISNPPEAEVSIILPGKESLKPLGKTPLELEITKLEEAVDKGTVVIVVERDGYLPQRFVVPNLSSTSLNIEATLVPMYDTNYKELNDMISKVLNAERLVLEKRLDEALLTSNEIKSINENVAVAYEIEGTVYFLKSEFTKSRFAWLRAVELDPNNAESKTMLEIVEKKMGFTGKQKPIGR